MDVGPAYTASVAVGNKVANVGQTGGTGQTGSCNL
jgi:hypothetical protein